MTLAKLRNVFGTHEYYLCRDDEVWYWQSVGNPAGHWGTSNTRDEAITAEKKLGYMIV
jgi:hypothetical protein